MVGELVNFLTVLRKLQVPNHLSASIHVEGREARGAGRTRYLQLSPVQLCHGKCEAVHLPSYFCGLLYTIVSEESVFWVAHSEVLVNKPGQQKPYRAVDL